MAPSRDHAEPVPVAVLAAIAIASPVLLLLLWLIGIGFVGIVTGPELTAVRWGRYVVVSLALGSSIAGIVLSLAIKAMTRRRLPLGRAVVTAFAALVPVYAAISIITLTQAGNDEIVFMCALMLSVGVAVVCAQALSTDSADG